LAGLIPVRPQFLRGRDYTRLHSFANYYGPVAGNPHAQVSNAASGVHHKPGTASAYVFWRNTRTRHNLSLRGRSAPTLNCENLV
jgi:hypothetical protein